MKLSQNSRLDVLYRVQVVRAGRVVASRTGKNMVVDGGLNDLGNLGLFNRSDISPGQPFAVARYGNGTGPLKRGSAAVTFTTTGSGTLTVTASAGFFVAGDVGRILKLDSGEELRITAYTSGTVVTATTLSGSVTQGQPGTVHYVNDYGLSGSSVAGQPLLSEASRSYNSGTNTYTVVRYGDSPAVTAAATISEMGWFTGYGNFGVATGVGNMCGRVLLTTPIGVQVGDIVRLTLTINVVMDTSAIAVSAGDFSGTTRFWGDDSSGSFFNNLFFGAVSAFSGVVNQSLINTTTPNNAVSGFLGSGIVPAPSNPAPGVFVYTASFNVSTGNGTINTFGLSGAWYHKLTTPFAKDSTMTMSVTYTRTFRSSLSN